MSSVNPDRLTTIMQQLSAFDKEAGFLNQANGEERGTRLAALRTLASSIQSSLVASGVGLDAREVNAVSSLVGGSNDLGIVQRVADQFHETVSRIVSAEFSQPLERAVHTALQTGDLSPVASLATQIKSRGMEINLCRFAQGAFLLEYLLKSEKLTPQLLEGLLNLDVSANSFQNNPPLVHLLQGYLHGSYSQAETIDLLTVLSHFKLDVNSSLPGTTQSLLFTLQDPIYGWSLEETPGIIEADPHYMVTPQLFEPVIDLLSSPSKEALLASFAQYERDDLIKLFTVS